MKSKNNRRSNKVSPRKMQLQPLESRVVLAASLGWDGPGLGSAELTYYIANSPSSLSQAQTTAAIETALKAWSSVADIKFTATNQPGLKDSIDFSFTRIDGPAKTLAQAYFPDDVNSPRIAGDVQFDSSENWEIGNSQGNNAFDLVLTAVHEIGHSLGLDHEHVQNSVMAMSITTASEFVGLTDADKSAILELYQRADDVVATTQAGSSNTDSNSSETDDGDIIPFSREIWRHGGHWQRFGSRFDVGTSYMHNIYTPADVNVDNRVSATDALAIIGALSKRASTQDSDSAPLCDADNDGKVSAADALLVISTINSRSRSASSLTTVTMVVVSTESTAKADDSSADDSSADDSLSDDSSSDDSSSDDSSSDDSSSDDSSSDDSSTDDSSTDDSSSDDSATDDSSVCEKPNVEESTVHASALARLSAEGLMTRFDTDASGGLTQAELPNRVWRILVDANVDADSNSDLSPVELKTAITSARQVLFANHDSDSDGLLTSAELGQQRWGLIESADADASADISFVEYDAWLNEKTAFRERDVHGTRGPGHLADHSRRHSRDELWQVAADEFFERFDTDADSMLTTAEIPAQILAELLSKNVDGDNDGSISKDELTAGISAARSAFVSEADQDDDGQLTSQELGDRNWRKLTSADSDVSGSVSLEEFQAWVPVKPAHPEIASASERMAARGGRRR